ncbi:hypothetical protein [Dyadobacter psychrotolerans]|uniref:Uncharacterized protein n=1 Tax=Dyadobacter psychrotolerans TaxID=2541721 RepID=A0A4R5DHG6_9BACT|nr:hypothetical protein [Dyadobacter psychrotolerans]TDE11304.1 hypothetical protein E0F88_25670 [Dyadobacter psychrotolerans]
MRSGFFSFSIRITQVIAFAVTVTGCSILEMPKYSLSDGYYRSKSFHSPSGKVFIDNSEDTIYVYTVSRTTGLPDTVRGKHTLPQVASRIPIKSGYFRQGSTDVDFITIPFKYRPGKEGMPRQFNANLNGAVYQGYRNDIYRLSFKKNALTKYQRQTLHYGMSYGIFTGLGGTAMNPWVTNNNISSEYDGVVWSKGIAAIFGLNSFTAGVTLGFDNLLDRNKKFWIYQKKPWIGLALGLNLN